MVDNFHPVITAASVITIEIRLAMDMEVLVETRPAAAMEAETMMVTVEVTIIGISRIGRQERSRGRIFVKKIDHSREMWAEATTFTRNYTTGFDTKWR